MRAIVFAIRNSGTSEMGFAIWQIRCLAMGGLCAVLISGCSGRSMQPAGGKVLVDGVPVKDGAVTFYPVLPGRAASASIMEDGTFVLSSDNPNDGLPEGEYKVTIVADSWNANVSEKEQKALEAMQKKQGAIEDSSMMSGGGRLTHIVPAVYNDIATTPLTQKVIKSSTPQEFIFDIPSKTAKK